MTRPADDGFHMPAEWAPHRRCWMAWPSLAMHWGERLEEAKDAYAELAQTIAEYEPVTLVTAPKQLAEASLRCGAPVACLPMPLDAAWMRDTGPVFLVDGRGGLAGVDWRFNGWGAKFAGYDHARDAAVARQVLEQGNTRVYEAPMVLEGGSVHVDGEGTLLTSEQCLLNPNRNPDLSKSEIEELLRTYLGVRQIIWLGEGLVDDAFLAQRTEGFETLREHLESFTPQWAEEITGVPAADIEQAAIWYGQAERGAIYYTLGITEHICGVDNVQSLCNLVLMTGNIGREGTGINPMRGQNNIQGAGDSGALPNNYQIGRASCRERV